MQAVHRDLHVESMIDAIRADDRVDLVIVKLETIYTWSRQRLTDGIESGRSGVLQIKANTSAHGAGGRGVAASETYEVARLLVTDGLVTHIELVHSAPYGLVRLVEAAVS